MPANQKTLLQLIRKSMQIAAKTWVVTGTGGGIGRELTLQLLRKGANVAEVGINVDALQQTGQLAEVGQDGFKAFPLDITAGQKSLDFLSR